MTTAWDLISSLTNSTLTATRTADAIVYLTLANKLIHEFNPGATTIAEEMSGMPGLAASG